MDQLPTTEAEAEELGFFDAVEARDAGEYNCAACFARCPWRATDGSMVHHPLAVAYIVGWKNVLL